MAIPSKQIGWSNESNLIWEIAKEVEQITQILGQSNPSGNSPTGNLGIRSKQIGWSNEANLLYELLKQVARLRQTIP
jgi:hypothetical protein